jgi:hypothetical protein
VNLNAGGVTNVSNNGTAGRNKNNNNNSIEQRTTKLE